LRFFAPQRRHVVPMGVKFGTEGLRAKFHPLRCNGGYRTPKLKFLLRFDQNVEYKRPGGAYPLRDFHKICRVCTPFQDALAVKISLDLALIGNRGSVQEPPKSHNLPKIVFSHRKPT